MSMMGEVRATVACTNLQTAGALLRDPRSKLIFNTLLTVNTTNGSGTAPIITNLMKVVQEGDREEWTEKAIHKAKKTVERIGLSDDGVHAARSLISLFRERVPDENAPAAKRAKPGCFNCVVPN